MDPITFAQLLLRRWWLFVLFGVAGLGISYYIATSTPPRYISSVSLQLNASGKSPFLPYASQGISTDTSPVVALAASYREVLRSRAFGEVVVQQLQLSIPPDAVGGAVNTFLVPNTNILRMNVVWDNPSDAQQLAQRIAEIFIVENQRRQQSQPVTQAQLANMEQSASDLQDRLIPLQQQEQQLTQTISRGDLSHIAELTPLEERLASLQSSHANLLVEISRIRSSFDTAVIVDNATPASPVDSTPILQALVFGLLGGLGAALGLALVLEYLADAVRTRQDIVEVAGVPPLARVRHTSTKPWRRARASNSALVMLNPARSPAAEAFRSLRASLRLATPSRPIGSLVITSAGAREGKTFVACNLAIALAQSGRRVLLADADLRRPMVHAWFGLPNERGFADALREIGESRDVPGVIATGLDNLWVLPAGGSPPSPAELLGTDALPHLIEHLSQRWDTVVFDSAPVGPVADTLLLASQASGSVLVARCGRTRRTALQGALAALAATGRPVLGVVLNDERPDPLSRFSRFDYYHHGYWSDRNAVGHSENQLQALHNGSPG
jgi:polysaccharide biosynthesis transport protein